MEQPKAALTSPSLQAPSPHAAGDPVGAASRGSLARSRGAPIDTPANRRYSPQPIPDVRAPGCRDNPHPSVASPAATFGDGYVDTLAYRSTFVRGPADAARIPCRTRHTAASPSMRLHPANLAESANDLSLTPSSPTQGQR